MAAPPSANTVRPAVLPPSVCVSYHVQVLSVAAAVGCLRAAHTASARDATRLVGVISSVATASATATCPPPALDPRMTSMSAPSILRHLAAIGCGMYVGDLLPNMAKMLPSISWELPQEGGESPSQRLLHRDF